MNTHVSGFTTDQEPVISEMSDGSLEVEFSEMPPIDARDEEMSLFDKFDKVMQEAIGVEVVWEDRDLFIIPKPLPCTADDIVCFLQECREDVKK